MLDPAERTHRIEYTENTITEYIIPSGTAISGSYSGHYFGVICDSNFYFGNPTKGNKFKNFLVSWTYFGLMKLIIKIFSKMP